jgi:hypothetical protein
MSRAKPPADDLAGFEVEDDCEVVLLAPEAEMSEILHPGAGIRHVSVALPSLWFALIAEDGKLFQGVRCGRYLC